MLVRLNHGVSVNTDHIKYIRRMDGYYEVYVFTPDYVPLTATPTQVQEIMEAINGDSN